MPLQDYRVVPAGYDGEIEVVHVPDGFKTYTRPCRWEWAPDGNRFSNEPPVAGLDAIDMLDGIPVDKLIAAVVEHEQTCPHAGSGMPPASTTEP